MATKLKTDCVTPTGRLSYPSLFKTKEQMTKGVFKFEATILFSKKTDLSELKKMLTNAMANQWGTDPKKWPKITHPAIKDGDEKADQQAYAGCWYITPKANPDRRPQLFGPDKSPLVEDGGTDVLFAGRNVKAYVNAFAGGGGATKMAPYCTFGLNAVQAQAGGDRLDGRKDASDMFDAIEDDAENPSNYANSEETDSAFA